MFRETIIQKWDIVTIQPPLFCIPFPHVEYLLSLLLDFSWPQKNITSFVVPLIAKGFLVYRRLEKFYTAISSVIDLSNKFMDWRCFGDRWCLMNAFRVNCYIRFREAHSNNRWHKFHGSIWKFFGCIDHKLAWLYFSENDVFDGSAYVIHWDFAIVSLIVELAQWLIQEHCSC